MKTSITNGHKTFPPALRRWYIRFLVCACMVCTCGCSSVVDPRCLIGAAVGVAAITVIQQANKQANNRRQSSMPAPAPAPAQAPSPGIVKAAPGKPVFQQAPAPQPAPTPLPQEPSPEQDKVSKGINAYQDGRYEQAINNLEQAINGNRLDLQARTTALTYAAASAYWLGNMDQATRLAKQLAAICPNPEIDREIFPPEFRQFVSQVCTAR